MHSPTPELDLGQLTRGLWVARFYYFFFFAALGTISPFLNVYLMENGLTGTQIGLIASLPPLVALAAGPFWSAVADRWHAQQGVLALLAFVAGLSSMLLIWVHAFWGVLFILVILNFFRAPISAILDGTVMAIISRYGERYNLAYGKVRVFGSIGWIIAAFSVGWIAGSWSLDAIFWIHGITLGLLCMLLSFRLPVERSHEKVDYRSGVGQLIRLRGYRGVLVFMAAFGAGAAANSNFLGLQILALGGTTQLIGIANATNSIPEIPAMFMGDRWLRQFGSRKLILTGGVGFTITWILLGSATQAWHIPLVTPLIGLFFAISWVALVSFANQSAPQGMRASAQGISNAAMSGIGVAGGAFISGILWDRFGGSMVFYVAAVIMALGTLYFASATREGSTPMPGERAS